jgi:hypothetical protein
MHEILTSSAQWRPWNSHSWPLLAFRRIHRCASSCPVAWKWAEYVWLLAACLSTVTPHVTRDVTSSPARFILAVNKGHGSSEANIFSSFSPDTDDSIYIYVYSYVFRREAPFLIFISYFRCHICNVAHSSTVLVVRYIEREKNKWNISYSSSKTLLFFFFFAIFIFCNLSWNFKLKDVHSTENKMTGLIGVHDIHICPFSQLTHKYPSLKAEGKLNIPEFPLQ